MPVTTQRGAGGMAQESSICPKLHPQTRHTHTHSWLGLQLDKPGHQPRFVARPISHVIRHLESSVQELISSSNFPRCTPPEPSAPPLSVSQLSSLPFYFSFYTCIFVHMYVCTHARSPLGNQKGGVGSPGTEIGEGCEPSCGCWDLNLGPVE